MFSEKNRFNQSVTIFFITWASLLYKLYLINPSNPETLIYCPLNIPIHAQLPAQETYRSMLLLIDIDIPIISTQEKKQILSSQIVKFWLQRGNTKMASRHKTKYFWFFLIVIFLFKHHTENFKTVTEFIYALVCQMGMQ